MEYLSLIIIAVSAFVIGWLVAHLRLSYLHVIQRLERLEKQNPKRHTQRTDAGLLDAIAVLLDAEVNNQIEALRLQRAREILYNVKAGPQNYDPDQPNNRKNKP